LNVEKDILVWVFIWLFIAKEMAKDLVRKNGIFDKFIYEIMEIRRKGR